MSELADGEPTNSREPAAFEWGPFTPSCYRAEHVVVGKYELFVIQKHAGSEDGPTLGDVLGPPRRSRLLRTGRTDNFDAAKRAAELALAALRKP